MPIVNDNVLITPVDVTGTTAVTLVVAPLPLQWVRVLGFALSSQGAGNAVLTSGGVILTQVTFPGVAVLPPDYNFGLAGTPGQSLTINADTAGVRIVGHVLTRVETLFRSGVMGSPMGLLLALTKP